MSSYIKSTKHPETGVWHEAQWLDDRLGPHHYGVLFPDGTLIDPWEVPLETREMNDTDVENDVIQRITALCDANFAGDLHAMFVHYAPTGKLNYEDIVIVLTDAGVGNGLTRGSYANRIIAKIDTDFDSMISEAELTAAISAHGGS